MIYWGQGIFESLRCYRGEFFLLEEHLNRFFASAQSLGWKLPFGKQEIAQRMREDFLEDYRRREKKSAFVRINLYQDCERKKFELVTNVIPKKEYPAGFYREGISLASVPSRKNSPASLNPRIKSTNMLGGVFAFEEARTQRVFDALSLSEQGYVTEGSVANFFLVKEGSVMTASSHTGILEGVTRDYLIRLACGSGIPVAEIPLTRHDVYCAEEAFLTNTSMGVMPVREVDARQIGTGVPGAFTRRLMKQFNQAIQEWEAQLDQRLG